MTTECFIAARAVQISGCLLLFGLFAFERFVIASAWRDRQAEAIRSWWRLRMRTLVWFLLPVILVSGIVWFGCVAMTMSDLPLHEALQAETLRAVWSQTRFGTVWQIRLVLWVACAAAICAGGWQATGSEASKRLFWLALVLSGAMLGSLTWAGHGQEGQPPGWHICADVAHLLVAGVWPAGLLPLVLLLNYIRRRGELGELVLATKLVCRFSNLSIAGVVGLVLTGWINSWFLVGSFANLFQQPFGRWLMAKIILFIFVVGIGAMNLLRLKPQLLKSFCGEEDLTLMRLRRNIMAELILSTVIIIVVGVLGILPPAAH